MNQDNVAGGEQPDQNINATVGAASQTLPAKVRLLTPYTPDQYDGITIRLSVSEDRFSSYETHEGPLTEAIQRLTGPSGRKKQWRSVVFAKFEQDQRTAEALLECTAIPLHFKPEVTAEQIEAAQVKFGCLSLQFASRTFVSGTEETQCLVIFLREPFVIFAEGRPSEAMAKWHRIVAVVAKRLGLLVDQSRLNPSGAIRLPPPNEFFEASLNGGDLFDWRALDVKSLERELTGKSNAPATVKRDVPKPRAEKSAPDTESPVEKIETAISGLSDYPPGKLVAPIITDIAKLDDEYEEPRLLGLLSRKKIAIDALRTMLAREKRGPGGKKGVELKFNQEGRAIFSYHGSFNDDDLVKVVRATLTQKNYPHASNQLSKPTPILTVMLGKPMKLRKTGKGTVLEELDQGAFHAEVTENLLIRNIEGAGATKHVKQEISNICFKTAQDYLPQAPDIVRNPLFDSQLNLIREPGWYKTPEGMPLDAQHNIFIPQDCLRVRKVSDNPSPEELKQAVKLIREDLLGEFPFLTIDNAGVERREAAEANAIAMLLTPYVRRACPGHTPMFFITKPTPGTGGTLLGRIPMILADQEVISINLKKGEEEIAKGMVAAMLSSRGCMFFDNVKGSNINSDIILVSLTSRMIGDRVLGQSKLIERLNTYLWVATGNNPIIWEELYRRIAFINLNAKTANVKARKFKKKNFENWVKENRAEIVWALLTMIQSWVSRGKKPFITRTLPSFDEWAEIVGGILENAGIEGFLDTPERIASDQDQSAANELVRKWWQEWTTAELSVKDLVDFAIKKDLDAWTGKTDDDKRRRFLTLLNSFVGRTFVVDAKSVMVHTLLNRDSDLRFKLVEDVKTAESND